MIKLKDIKFGSSVASVTDWHVEELRDAREALTAKACLWDGSGDSCICDDLCDLVEQVDCAMQAQSEHITSQQLRIDELTARLVRRDERIDRMKDGVAKAAALTTLYTVENAKADGYANCMLVLQVSARHFGTNMPHARYPKLLDDLVNSEARHND